MPAPLFSDPAWWIPAGQSFLILQLMTLAAWPWFTRLFAGRADRGAGLAPAGGILIYLLAANFLWRSGCWHPRFVWSALLLCGIGLGGHFGLRKARPSPGTRARMRASFVEGWILFALLFWYWALIRAAAPGVTHTEQPMDVMWMRAAAAADSPPIRDAWFGGEPATYYADGHQALSFVGSLLGLPVQVSVNLTQIIWFALTGLLVFQSAKALAELSLHRSGRQAGWIALALVCFVSTPQGFFSALKTPTEPWWWWQASRVLQDGDFPLITEFPFFSFWLGDNHAHLIGIPFLLFSLLSSLNLMRIRRIRPAAALLPCLLLFLSWRINPWQLPTVLALLLLCLFFRPRKLSAKELLSLGGGALCGLLLLFPLRSGGPDLQLMLNQGGRTSLTEFLKVFGFLVPGLLPLISRKRPGFLCALALLLAGMFAVAELVFLQDVFQNRMNTVFKVYYQIWILMGLLAAVGWTRLLRAPGPQRHAGRLLLLLFLLPGLSYAVRLSGQALRSPRQNLNAWSVYSPAERKVLETANRLIQPGDRIAEAPGTSYDSFSSRLGTWTAGNTILGWRGHQMQWRPGTPHPDLKPLYEAGSPEELAAEILGLRLDWIALGPRERKMFAIPTEWESWLDSLAYRVVDQPGQRLYRIK
ncbi:MAG: DUF2298 domain-containing protein [Kiritimatiellia bacterium]